MSEKVLQAFSDVVVVNGNHIALEISLDLKNRPQSQQREAFAGDFAAGYLYLHRMDKFPDMVFECVVSVAGDAISSVYKNHRIFATTGELLKARQLLTSAIASKVGLSANSVGIDDPGRGRTLGLTDLSTGQLIDMLAERMGSSIIVTTSHSAAGVGGLTRE